MSADNGIYILKTPKGLGFEYRVRELRGVEEYKWNSFIEDFSNDPDVWIENAREMWKDSVVLTNHEDALNEAFGIYQAFQVLEYGVCDIEIPREF